MFGIVILYVLVAVLALLILYVLVAVLALLLVLDEDRRENEAAAELEEAIRRAGRR